MLEDTDILPLFERAGAYLKGHFRLSGGLHSGEYMQSALVLRNPTVAEELGKRLAAKLKELAGVGPVGLTVSPALGGLIIGHEVARALGTPFLFTERDQGGTMSLRRGFAVEPGTRAVVVEDVVTTGRSTLEVMEILREQGAQVVAVGCLIDRSGGTVDLAGVPLAALKSMQVIAYDEKNCPFCRGGLPVTKPGSRPAGNAAD